MATSVRKHVTEMKREDLPNCHDGAGTLDWTVVIDGGELPGRRLRFMHDDRMPPGASVGVHTHQDDEEYYYIIEGHGTMTLDGERFEVGPGDITGVFPGGSHGLENTGNDELRLIVVSVEGRQER